MTSSGINQRPPKPSIYYSLSNEYATRGNKMYMYHMEGNRVLMNVNRITSVTTTPLFWFFLFLGIFDQFSFYNSHSEKTVDNKQHLFSLRLLSNRPVLQHSVVIVFWSSGIMYCMFSSLKIEFHSYAWGRRWCGIFHYHW